VYTAYAAGLAASGVVSYMDPVAALAVFDRALEFQVTYGAVMLSFLGQLIRLLRDGILFLPCSGAMHWGMEIAAYDGQKGYRRLALGAAPMLIAWPTLVMGPITALIVQWLGFTGLWLADAKATMAGWSERHIITCQKLKTIS